jgi:hypothetical protein
MLVDMLLVLLVLVHYMFPMVFVLVLLSNWLSTGLTLFVLTLVLCRSLALALGFDFAGGRLRGLLVDRLRRMVIGDRRWPSSKLTLVMSKENIIFGDDGWERVIKVSS